MLFLCALSYVASAQPHWRPVTKQTKPWSRWWWMGNAVNRQDLSIQLQQYQQIGLGGLEITPIYGVKGREKEFINLLSPEWMTMLGHTLYEAKRLDLGIDVANASGWPFGGPWVSQEDACKYIMYETYTLSGGERLSQPIQYMQKPIARAVNRQVSIENLKDPVVRNDNLQALALDQVRFPKPIPLVSLMAYSNDGQSLDLTTKVNATGQLDWTAPAGKWTLYGVFQGWHGKQVERAGPGGEGDVIDHFSKPATERYLKQFDKIPAPNGIRAYFNDSYEVDDAQGQANWTPQLWAAFQQKRGYDLRAHLPALFGKDTPEQNQRVLSDYRETISELLLENFTQTWHDWAQKKGKIVRNQAHGSPANILDLYSVVDIPEIEGTELLRIKFASSAAHVMGKRLTSSESATWLDEHFKSSLGGVKQAIDRFFVGGVNHIFYHGTNYSPPSEAFPGWLFYAAVHFMPQNPFWRDFGTLNQYVTRCQSFLQTGKPDNDVLLYFPIYDSFAHPSNRGLLHHYDGIGPEFKGTDFEENAEEMLKKGFSFDFVSDKQLQQVVFQQGKLRTGGVDYQTIVVSGVHFMPLTTLQKLIQLAKQGATVIFYKNLPVDVPGLGNLAQRQGQLKQLLASLPFKGNKAIVGKGVILQGEQLEELLQAAQVRQEPMVEMGLQFVRRSDAKNSVYFIANSQEQAIDGWIPLASKAASAALYNPMTGQMGMAATRNSNGKTEVYLQLAAGESCLIETFAQKVAGKPFPHYQPDGTAQTLVGTWNVRFVNGGPTLPALRTVPSLTSWTDWGDEDLKRFSGTAAYSITFAKPVSPASAWLLDLGTVHESARVVLNGKEIGTLLGPSYQVVIPATALQAQNQLVVEVSNSMANRIIDLDKQGIRWQKFYNINMSMKQRENRGDDGVFTAKNWSPTASGMVGNVTLTPLKQGEKVRGER
ncbi:MAG: glycosyl hydrolase [Spirosomataceae bacterium]